MKILGFLPICGLRLSWMYGEKNQINPTLLLHSFHFLSILFVVISNIVDDFAFAMATIGTKQNPFQKLLLQHLFKHKWAVAAWMVS